jgi:hypothetical protein
MHRGIAHVLNDDPFVAEVDKPPDPQHQSVLLRNPRRLDGERLTTTAQRVITVLYP